MQKWTGRLHIKAAECDYKEHDWQHKEQFINIIDKEEIM